KDFEKWNRKGEFEKESDYVNRLETQSQTIFDNICIKHIKSQINSCCSSDDLRKELSTYNTEGEFFTASFKLNGVEWESKINIPISKAQEFIRNWSDITYKISVYDWCFVEDRLSPTSIILVDRRENSE